MEKAKSSIVKDLLSLWELKNLSEDAFKALFEAISEVQLSPKEHRLYDAVPEEHRNLMQALLGIAVNISPDKDELRDLLYEYIDEITECSPNRISDDQVTLAVARAFKLLTSRPVQLFSSSTHLRFAHEHIFSGARIVTDIRPILAEDTDTGDPQVAAVMRRHNLIITSCDRDMNTHDNFFVLDDEDLDFLLAVLVHAKETVPALKQLTMHDSVSDLSLS